MALSPNDWRPHPAIPQQPRDRPMQVLCLGLSRTSTMSLYFALNKLGYNSYHYVEASLNAANGSLPSWHEAVQAKYFGEGTRYSGKDFEKMLWRYDAVTDIPAVLFADELLEAYPDAKVILTTRDADSWLRSVENSFYEILSWKGWKVLQLVDHYHARYHVPLLKSALQIWTSNDWQNRAKLKEGFNKHNAHIRQVVPKERLLEFHSSQGWGPLCSFLGQPVPDEPFPKVNEGDFAAMINARLFWFRATSVLLRGSMYLAPIFIAASAAWWFRRQS